MSSRVSVVDMFELEQKIMEEIGFHNDYTIFNGRSVCKAMRTKAVKMLPRVILQHYRAGEKIAFPDTSLISILQDIAVVGDVRDDELKKTWHAVSYVIVEHLYQAKTSVQTRQRAYNLLETYLKTCFLPKINFKLIVEVKPDKTVVSL